MLDDLPRIDEHSVDVAAPPEAVWDVVHQRFGSLVRGSLGDAFARLLGCEPRSGFAVVAAQRPTLLIVAGRHRFSRYGIVFRISPRRDGSRLSAESRAEFPGLHGALYRAAVVGTRTHVVAVRGLLTALARQAERG
jgi:hypothetical protein